MYNVPICEYNVYTQFMHITYTYNVCIQHVKVTSFPSATVDTESSAIMKKGTYVRVIVNNVDYSTLIPFLSDLLPPHILM